MNPVTHPQTTRLPSEDRRRQLIDTALDFFARQEEAAPIGVAGYGEGGLLALYAAAADTRIDAALVDERHRVFEPGGDPDDPR